MRKHNSQTGVASHETFPLSEGFYQVFSHLKKQEQSSVVNNSITEGIVEGKDNFIFFLFQFGKNLSGTKEAKLELINDEGELEDTESMRQTVSKVLGVSFLIVGLRVVPSSCKALTDNYKLRGSSCSQQSYMVGKGEY